MRALRDVLRTIRTAPGFTLALVITLAAAAFNGLMVLLMALRLDFLLPGPFAQMGHFTESHHRIHDLTFAFLFVPTLVGILAQLRRPSRNVAGMLMALIPSIGLLLVVLLTAVAYGNARTLQPPWLTVMAGAVVALVLHPAGRDFFLSFTRSRISRTMLAMTAGASVPLLTLAVRSIVLQGTVGDDHAAAGHYGFMTAFAFTVIGVALLATLRPDGWRLTAWVGGLLPLLLGVASLTYPTASSSLSLPWALSTIAWGTGFVAAAESARHGERPQPVGRVVR
ncbi:MAG: hypothetical protein ACRDUY_09890 [Nitriliruptorales bacterium]